MARLQQNSGTADAAAGVTVAFLSDVAAGSLVVLCVAKNSATAFAAGDCTKSAGTATIGTITLDAQEPDTTPASRAGIYSVPVTGAGSLTLNIAGAAGTYWFATVSEYSNADVSSSRVDGSAAVANGGSNSPASGSITSTADAIFVAIVDTQTGGSLTHTPSGSYSQIGEEENGAAHQTGNAQDRIVTTSTASNATWTLGSSANWAAVQVCYHALPAGVCWGESAATEAPTTWQEWEKSAGVPLDVSGDQAWGDAELATGVPIYSPVEDMGDANSKTITVTPNKYGTAGGNYLLEIRGDAAVFGKWDGSPAWATYSAPVTQAWRYVQLRLTEA